MLIARRVLGESDHLKISMRLVYARAIYQDPGATLDDLREAVTTLEETLRTARRVLGGSHPTTSAIEDALRVSREVLRAREFNIARAAHPEKLYFDPAVGFTGPPVNFPREGEEQAETPSF